MKSSQTTIYNSVPKVSHPRSTFRMPAKLTTSFSSSKLLPIYCRPVLPGDTLDMSVSNFIRMNPTVTPFLDNIHVEQHWFFVPNRLVWENWEKFLGSQDNPSDSIDFVIPQIVSPVTTGWIDSSLGAYFGIRQGVAGISTSSLPFRAYNLIYNQWFRPETLTNSAVVDTDNGPDTVTDYIIRPRFKFHDYFTAALPSPQRGSAVMIPATFTTALSASTAPVYGDGKSLGLSTTGSDTLGLAYPGTVLDLRSGSYNAAVGGAMSGVGGTTNKNVGVVTSGASGLQTDLSGVHLTSDTTGTINALRTAEAIQTYLERNNRGGTRYTEFIRSHFGVISPDARLQRPEYLGGNSVPLNMIPVTQNSETATTPQGNLSGMGMMNSHDTRFIKSFTEHGYVIGLCSARSDISYQQGTERHWFDSTRFDFYVPALANLGEQAILNREIFTQATSADTDVFGYIPRWDHLRYQNNLITGALNSDAPYSMDNWTLAQDFPACPVLNTSFVTDATPELRVLNVTNEPTFMGQFYFEQKWTRVMPMNSIPGMGVRL